MNKKKLLELREVVKQSDTFYFGNCATCALGIANRHFNWGLQVGIQSPELFEKAQKFFNLSKLGTDVLFLDDDHKKLRTSKGVVQGNDDLRQSKETFIERLDKFIEIKTKDKQ